MRGKAVIAGVGHTAYGKHPGRDKIDLIVEYHVAFHEAFESKLPYNVAIVELAEGPRVLTNIIESPAGRQLEIGAASWSSSMKVNRCWHGFDCRHNQKEQTR